MRRVLPTFLLFAAFASGSIAAPPQIDIPSEVKPTQGYIRFTPKTDAVSVTYVSLDGLYPFPSEELKDSRRFVLPVSGVQAGRYRFVAVGASGTGEQATREFTAVIGDAPIPPVPPGPNPPVPPEPKPPGPVTSFHVIFVYETSKPITPAMQQVMFGEKVRTYLDAKTNKGAGGNGWRKFDPDISVVNERDASIKGIWTTARPAVTTVPCVMIEVNNHTEIVNFPASEDDALAVFKKYRGE